AQVFHALAAPSALAVIDRAVPLALAAVGLSLILGLFTRAGCWGALILLAGFYLSAIPTSGVPQPGGEGTYLLVSKNLIEAAAVFVLLVFRTGAIAGLDLLFARRTTAAGMVPAAASAGPKT